MGYKISFIGSGNVATNLAHAFDKSGHTINQVISRNLKNAKALASKFGAYYGDKPSTMYKDSDFVILCVSDKSYDDVMKEMPGGMDSIVCHTAGPVDMDVLSKYSGKYGVIYPLQSLRKEEIKDLLDVPVFIEWSSRDVKEAIHSLADSISNVVREVDSKQREKYHLAAVFANNFTNLMYVIAEDYLKSEKLEFKNLLPIINETAQRLKSGEPSSWQTGPAKRKDVEVLEKHMSMIDDPKIKEVYKSLSELLMTKF
ncbi:MAG: Rossmann-like and DUF2520 domain-containing protein [Bacteroidia bacterium]